MSKTQKEIQAKIEELSAEADNFTDDNYGSEGADNGHFETYYSETNTQRTFQQFAAWLYDDRSK